MALKAFAAPFSTQAITDYGNSNEASAAIIVCAVLTGLTIVNSAAHILSFHASNRAQPHRPKVLIMEILTLPPVFCVLSLLIEIFPGTGPYLDPIRTAYDAFIVYKFYHLLEALFGGHDKAAEVLSKLPPQQIYGVPPCCCFCRPCCGPAVLDASSLRTVSLLVRQLVITTPICALLEIIINASGRVSQSNAPIILQAIQSSSTLWALYGLFIFFFASHKRLAEYHVILKFVTIKVGLLAAILQNLLFTFLARVSAISANGSLSGIEYAQSIQSFLIVIEFFLIGIAFRFAFPVHEFDSKSSIVMNSNGGEVLTSPITDPPSSVV